MTPAGWVIFAVCGAAGHSAMWHLDGQWLNLPMVAVCVAYAALEAVWAEVLA